MRSEARESLVTAFEDACVILRQHGFAKVRSL